MELDLPPEVAHKKRVTFELFAKTPKGPERISQGDHCAYGLTDMQKRLADYGGQAGTCIMFGENSGSDPSSATTGYCPECSDYIKARDLRDLTTGLE